MKTLTTDNYTAEYNEDLDGYVFLFKNGKEGAAQYNTVNNVLDADNGEQYLSLYEDGCIDLSEYEYELIEQFIEKNKWKDYLAE